MPPVVDSAVTFLYFVKAKDRSRKSLCGRVLQVEGAGGLRADPA